jgi:hypothetical protein
MRIFHILQGYIQDIFGILLYIIHKELNMKKVFCFALICLLAVISCEFPEKITVKGKPSLYVPLGDIPIGDMLAKAFDIDSVKDMMGGGSSNITMYDYIDPNSDIKKYIAHFPLTEMKLDFEEYIQEAMKNDNNKDIKFEVYPEDVDLISDLLSSTYTEVYLNGKTGPSPVENPADPTFKIELSEMHKLVKQVQGEFGFIVEDDPAGLGRCLEVKIPSFNFSDYKSGVSDGNGNLLFIGDYEPLETYTIIYPQTGFTDGFVEIYIRVKDAVLGTIDPDLVFNWEKATVQTEGEDFSDTIDFDLNLSEFLGDNIKFKKLEGYIYFSGVEDNSASLTLIANKDKASEEELLDEVRLLEKAMPVLSPGDPYTGAIPAHSLNPLDYPKEYIDLKVLLEPSATLKYDVFIETIDVENDDEEVKAMVISADLIVVIELDFWVTDEDPLVDGYAKLDIKELEDLFKSEGSDIFSRTGNSDDLINNIYSVKLILLNVPKKKDSFLDLDNLAVFVENGSTGTEYSGLIEFVKDKPSLTINMRELEPPFSPKITLLAKTHEPGKASFAVYQQDDMTFSFFLAVEAKADINLPMEL